jgi:hypothetical protein
MTISILSDKILGHIKATCSPWQIELVVTKAHFALNPFI